MTNTPHIVAIGGGGGATQVLKAAQHFTQRLTAVIAVTDTGRSTGVAREIANIPAPGDIRATIASFANDALIANLLQHRFSGAGVSQLQGMAFGNLMIGALAEVLGDFNAAVDTIQKWAGSTARVLPVSKVNTQLCAKLVDGSIRQGELDVRGRDKAAIDHLFLLEPAPAQPEALAAIRDADLVVVGPGSLFTTVLATLLFDGMAAALRDTRGTVVYVCNTTTQPGQTDHFTALDHVRQVVDAVGSNVIDVVLINNSEPDTAALKQYEAEGLFLLKPGADELQHIQALGVHPIVCPLTESIGENRALWNKQDTVRHDTDALRVALRQVLEHG